MKSSQSEEASFEEWKIEYVTLWRIVDETLIVSSIISCRLISTCKK